MRAILVPQSSGGGREGITEAAQVLVGALQGVMAPASYAAALVSLATDTQASVAWCMCLLCT